MTLHTQVEQHYRRFFEGHSISSVAWLPGPMATMFPSFRVLAIEPGHRTGLWTYASVGVSEMRVDPRLEFVVLAENPHPSLVELLTMVAYYHHTERLGLGHTLPIGRPWLPDATCDHMLVSLPYPFGPDLEICNLSNGQPHVLWLLPITASERALKQAYGLEELEQRFDEGKLEFWQPQRASFV